MDQSKITKFQQILPVIINNKLTETIKSTDLHNMMGSNYRLGDWCKEKIINSKFLRKDIDYIITEESVGPGRPRKIYHLKYDAAKKIAMQENTSEGNDVRDYFILCEKKVKKNNTLKVLERQIRSVVAEEVSELKKIIIYQNKSISELKTLVIESSNVTNSNISNNIKLLNTNMTTSLKSLTSVIKGMSKLVPTNIVPTIKSKIVAIVTSSKPPVLPISPVFTLDASDYLNKYVRHHKGSWGNYWTKSTQIKLFALMRTLGWVHGIFPVDQYIRLGYIIEHKNKVGTRQTKITPEGIEELFKELQRQGIIRSK
jgi:phage anti-repressor protein